ncbi:MAG: hypothetical protein ACKN9W_12000 [Methylococcus sp.]
MKIVAIAGLESPYLDRLEQMLNNAGMATASILHEDESIPFVQWHDTLINRLGSDFKDAKENAQYHNELVLMMNEVCSVNKDHALWGWADHTFVWTLDLWLQNLPNFHALLPCYGPDRWLASRMVDEPQHFRTSEELNQWLEVHQQLLRVHFRYPDRTVLVDGYDCLTSPWKLLNYLTEKWQFPLDCDSSQALELPELDPMAHFLAQQISQVNAEVWTLQQTIQASLEVFSPEEMQDSRKDLDLLEGALQGYRETQLSLSHLERVEALFDEAQRENSLLGLRQTELEQLHEANLLNERGLMDELENLTIAYRDQIANGQELSNAIEDLKQELSTQANKAVEYKSVLDNLALELQASRNSERHLQAELETMKSVKAECNALSEKNHQLQTEYENAQTESALLLEQLHAVQEELEKVFLKAQGAEQEITELQVERDKQVQLAAERQGQIGTLTAQRDSEAKAKAAAQSQLDAQAQLANELRDQTKVLTQERDALDKRIAELEKTLNAATLTESELQKQTDKVMQLEAELKDNQEENTLLLEQLHMVQEELESLFLKSQDAGQNVGELTAERDRLTQLVREKQEIIENLTETCDKLNELSKKRRAQIDARENLITDLRERIKVLGAECNAQTKLSNQKQKQIEKLQGLQADIKTLRQDNQKLHELVQQLQDMLGQSSRAANKVEGEESPDDQCAKAREDLVAELNQRIENLEKLAKSRRSQIDQRDEVIKDLRDRCNNLKEEINAQARLAMTLGESLAGPGRKPEPTALLDPDETI